MKTGYVLSGGGARGFAHLGVLQFMEELSIKPYAISGTSAGAIVGAMYASGLRPEEILSTVKKTTFFGLGEIVWKQPGMFSMDRLEDALRKIISNDDFDALRIKLFVTASNLDNGKEVRFQSGPIVTAILASSSVPGLFAPVVINDMLLADGGILNNFPIEPLLEICEVIIGSHVNNIIHPLAQGGTLSTINEMDRSFHMAIAPAVYAKSNRCSLFLDPILPGFGMFDVKRADELFEKGYAAAALKKQHILRLIDDHHAQ